jgi:hypothetical protein
MSGVADPGGGATGAGETGDGETGDGETGDGEVPAGGSGGKVPAPLETPLLVPVVAGVCVLSGMAALD